MCFMGHKTESKFPVHNDICEIFNFKQIKPVIHFSNNCSDAILCLLAFEEIGVTQLESPTCNIFFSAIEFVCNL